MKRRRWTLVYHRYIGYGSHVIEFKRAHTTAHELQTRERYKRDLHFVIPGWPPIGWPDGQAWDMGETK
jgi:hypothetical protein